MSDSPRKLPPYTALAAGYDLVMDHVDYEEWARYAHALLREWNPEAESVVELGCGTGSLALELQHLGGYDYLASDRSESMIRVARWKAQDRGVPLQFRVEDFTDLELDRRFDAAILLYDGLNYLLEIEKVEQLFRSAAGVLRPGGVFLVDQSTPSNSEADPSYFEDEGSAEGFAYRRTSRYDPETRRHTTRFELEVEGRSYVEEHVQRAYAHDRVRAVIEASPLELEAAYEGLTREAAGPSSDRIHWVTRKREKDSAS